MKGRRRLFSCFSWTTTTEASSDNSRRTTSPDFNRDPKVADVVDVEEQTQDTPLDDIDDSPSPRAPASHIVPKGLRNLGNTCFLNSALQCLLGTTLLTNYFAQNKHAAEINESNPIGTQGRLAMAYASLVSLFTPSEDDENIVRPVEFRAELCRFARQFGDYRQHDSQELLAFLLDGLHEDLNRCTTKPYTEDVEHDGSRLDEEVAAESWARHLLRNKSVIVDLFQGQLKNTLVCLECGRRNIRFDPFMYLSVPLPRAGSRRKSGPLTLDECIEYFSRQEELQGENQWYCPRCKTHRDATKRMELWKVPDVLFIHLKRFDSGRKRKQLVQFPLVGLDLSKFVSACDQPGSLLYDCFAVSNHVGSLHGGHYTAFTLHSGQWYLLDDHYCAPVEPQEICSPSAYVLLFARRTGMDMIRRQTLRSVENWPHRKSIAQKAIDKLKLSREPSAKEVQQPSAEQKKPSKKSRFRRRSSQEDGS